MNLAGRWLVKPIYLSVLIAFGIYGCDGSGQILSNKRTVTFPLLEECVNEVETTLNRFKDKGISAFDFSVEKFSMPIMSHQSVIGVVRLESESMEEKDLIMMANNPIAKCYPESSFSIDILDEHLGEKLLNEINFNKRAGVYRYYLIIDGTTLTAYFNGKSD